MNGLLDMFQHAHAPVGTASQKMVFDLVVIVGNLRVIVPAFEGQRVVSSQAGSNGDSELVGAFFLLYFFELALWLFEPFFVVPDLVFSCEIWCLFLLVLLRFCQDIAHLELEWIIEELVGFSQILDGEVPVLSKVSL
jgi:hypothetical protein